MSQDFKPMILSKFPLNPKPKVQDQPKQPDNKEPQEEIVKKKKTIDMEFSKQVVQARLAKKLSQEALAKNINVNVSVIKDYENGTAIQNGSIVSKLKKELNMMKKN